MYDELSEIVLGFCTVLLSTAVTSSLTTNPSNSLIQGEILNYSYAHERSICNTQCNQFSVLLTHSIQQSPSCECNIHSASQSIPFKHQRPVHAPPDLTLKAPHFAHEAYRRVIYDSHDRSHDFPVQHT